MTIRYDSPYPRQPDDDPLARAQLARDVATSQRLSGREIAESVPTNFLPPEQRTVTTEAPTVRGAVPDPRPGRPDPHAERLAAAEAAREAARITQLAGSANATTGRFIDPGTFVPVLNRDRWGRARVDWRMAHTQPDG